MALSRIITTRFQAASDFIEIQLFLGFNSDPGIRKNINSKFLNTPKVVNTEETIQCLYQRASLLDLDSLKSFSKLKHFLLRFYFPGLKLEIAKISLKFWPTFFHRSI